MRRLCAWVFACLALVASSAYADGKRDLEDGIAFYENLDTDRAVERLSAASKAGDLPPKDRARAFLYLGMVHFENGERPNAEAAWKSAFELDKNVEVPKGTSPKTIEAIEAARATIARPAQQPVDETPEPGDKPREATPELPRVTDTPPIEEKKDPDLTATTTPQKPDDDDSSMWIWLGAIGAAVVGAAVVGLVVATSGGDCEGGGGCVSVTFR